MNLPGETKAGNAAMQPMPRGKPGGLIETMNGAQRLPFCAPQEDHIGSEDPDALKIAARRAEYSLTESALSPFQAEPTQLRLGFNRRAGGRGQS
jgi:hypothetical protein